jgi:hypothetical protein
MASIKLVNMTSTEIFKVHVESTIGRLRHLATDSEKQFMPTQLGGVFGQKELLEQRNVMRQTTVRE